MRINIGLILCFFFWAYILIVTVRQIVHIDELEKPISLEHIIASWYLVHIYYIFNPLFHVLLNGEVEREVAQFFRGKEVEES